MTWVAARGLHSWPRYVMLHGYGMQMFWSLYNNQEVGLTFLHSFLR